ncbi:MAG: class I SAM-dependent methyltransferase [Candidatus Gracilibacteria bacterium]|jgi:predicted O-methyltransferase YrrM
MDNKIKSLLLELEKTSHIYWNIPRETGLFLNILAKTIKAKNILEIGTSNGYSGIFLAEAMSKTSGHLYTIESHKKERFYLAQKNFKTSGLSKYITQVLGHAPEAIPSHPKHFDMIFLDATKFEYIKYLEEIIPRTKKESIIIADNINSHRKSLLPYIKKIRSLKSFSTFLYPLGSGILVSVKK